MLFQSVQRQHNKYFHELLIIDHLNINISKHYSNENELFGINMEAVFELNFDKKKSLWIFNLTIQASIY